MEYILEQTVCDHCGAILFDIVVQHGFVYDFFECPHCHEENKR